MTTTTTDADVARRVSDFGRWVFEHLDELGAALQSPLSAPSPRRADLDIEDWCRSLLTDPRCPVAGAGAVMAPGVLADAPSTFTQPLVVGGVFAGVVGVDVLVAWFEEHLLEVMGTVDRACVLVNASGRVVTSSDPVWVTGDLVRDLPVHDWLAGTRRLHDQWTAVRCDGLPFVVLTPR